MHDLEFISGKFLDYEIPKSKRYLLRYFKTPMRIAWLKYYLVFEEHKNFMDHTGHYCTENQRHVMVRQYKKLTEDYEKAKKSLTEEGMEIVYLIESGKYRLT